MKTLGLCIAAGLGLSACASGGTMGNTNPNNIVTEYPVETAMLNIYTKQRSDRVPCWDRHAQYLYQTT